jgi:hypothetical protein
MLLPAHPAHASPASRAAPHTNKAANCFSAAVASQCVSRQRRTHPRCRPPGAAAEAGAAVSAPFAALSDWLTQNGGSVGSITAGYCQMGDVTVRGLVALDDLPPSTPILSVPVSR